MPRDRLVAYRQGQLDGLCGIYSVINAVRFALRSVVLCRPYRSPRPRYLSQGESELLFVTLLTRLVRTHRHARFMVSGVGANQLTSLLRAADGWLRDQRGLALYASRPLDRRGRVGTKMMLTCIGEHLSGPGSATIIGAVEPWAHWTVATRVTKSRLYLLDSEGDALVALRRGKRRLRYHAGLIDPASLYLLQLKEVE